MLAADHELITGDAPSAADAAPPPLPSKQTKPNRPLSIVGQSALVEASAAVSPDPSGNAPDKEQETKLKKSYSVKSTTSQAPTVDADGTPLSPTERSAETPSQAGQLRRRVLSFLRRGSFKEEKPVGGSRDELQVPESPSTKRSSFGLFRKESKKTESKSISGPLTGSFQALNASNPMLLSAISVTALHPAGLQPSPPPHPSSDPSAQVQPIKPSFEERLKKKIRSMDAQIKILQDTVNKLVLDNQELHKRLDAVSPHPDVASAPPSLPAPATDADVQEESSLAAANSVPEKSDEKLSFHETERTEETTSTQTKDREEDANAI
ncbi:hypothetical protein HDV03_003704 [Kappamyces sp. JEL0829]|nr:hypothetical protein HDV03_003704 [Kappamyces sp. JEL0829]